MTWCTVRDRVLSEGNTFLIFIVGIFDDLVYFRDRVLSEGNTFIFFSSSNVQAENTMYT